jgi:hypothetical protein
LNEVGGELKFQSYEVDLSAKRVRLGGRVVRAELQK